MYRQVTIPARLTIKEAAKAYHVSDKTIRAAVQRGELPAYQPNGRTFMMKADDLEKWYETTRYPA